MSGAALAADTRTEPSVTTRWAKPVCAGLALVFFVIAAAEFAVALSYVLPPGDSFLGMDLSFYREIAARWLETGVFYLPHQLSGPYTATLMVDTLYPPPALLLFVPFLVLPAILWWLVPVAVLGAFLAWCRPGPLAWPLLALVLVSPRTQTAFLFGNTDLWMAAAVAGGFRWSWPAALLVIKPTFLPFALVGVRRREFWIALALWPLCRSRWPRSGWTIVQAMRNMTIDADYSVGSLPLVLAPVVAWLLRTRSGELAPARS